MRRFIQLGVPLIAFGVMDRWRWRRRKANRRPQRITVPIMTRPVSKNSRPL